MRHTLSELKKFYMSPLGKMSQKILSGNIECFWPDSTQLRILGFGYVYPYFSMFYSETSMASHFHLAFPVSVGAEPCLLKDRNIGVCIQEENWPFPDAFYDRILIVHGLEESESMTVLLKECYRCLAPQGRLLLIVPNRNSIWSRSENTPFSYGQPFSKNQLEKRLHLCGFSVERARSALFIPPINFVLRAAKYWEYIGGRFWPGFGGVVCMEAGKQIPARIHKLSYHRIFLPVSS